LVWLRARGDARANSDLDLPINDAATAAPWAGSRWHVLGHMANATSGKALRVPLRPHSAEFSPPAACPSSALG